MFNFVRIFPIFLFRVSFTVGISICLHFCTFYVSQLIINAFILLIIISLCSFFTCMIVFVLVCFSSLRVFERARSEKSLVILMILFSFEVLSFAIRPILLIFDSITLTGLFRAECIFHSALSSIV